MWSQSAFITLVAVLWLFSIVCFAYCSLYIGVGLLKILIHLCQHQNARIVSCAAFFQNWGKLRWPIGSFKKSDSDKLLIIINGHFNLLEVLCLYVFILSSEITIITMTQQNSCLPEKWLPLKSSTVSKQTKSSPTKELENLYPTMPRESLEERQISGKTRQLQLPPLLPPLGVN